MRIANRIILVICITVLCFENALAAVTPTTNVTEEKAYDKNAYGMYQQQLLQTFGILDASEDPEKEITRRDFAVFTEKVLLSVGYAKLENPYRFYDVEEDSELYETVQTVAGGGFMIGFDDGTFRPEENIDINQAAAVFSRILDYEILDETGMKLNSVLVKGVKNKNGIFTAADMYVMCMNMLEAGIVKISNKIENGIKYELDEEDNLLSARMNIYKFEGRVTDNGETSVKGETKLQPGQLLVGNVTYNNLTGDDMLGLYVRGYYRYDEDADENSILYMAEAENRSKKITLNRDDVEAFTPDELTYETEKGTVKSLKISRMASYIINGIYSSSLTDEIIDNWNIGHITLLNYDNDSEYDLVMLDCYTSMAVNSINRARNIIFGMYDEQEDISEYETVKITKNGQEVPFGDLRKYDMLLILKNEKTWKAEIYTEAVYSKVSGVINDSGETKYVIDGKEYRFTEEYKNSNAVKPKIGDMGTFYIICGDRIAFFENEENQHIGILNKIITDAEDEQAVYIKIYTSEARWERYHCTGHVRVNGKNIKISNLKEPSNKLFDDDGEMIVQPITYRLDEERNLKSIITPDESMPDDDVIQPAGPKEHLQASGMSGDGVFLGKYQNAPRYFIKKDAIYFGIPDDPELTEYYKTQLNFPGVSTYFYDVRGYYLTLESKNMKTPDIFVEVKNGSAAETDGKRAAVVKEITSGINEDDEGCEILTVLTRGKEISYCATNSREINGISPGDLIRVYWDSAGNLSGYKKLYSRSNNAVFDLVRYNTDGSVRNGDEMLERAKELWGIGDFSKYDESSYYVGDFETSTSLPSPARPSENDYYHLTGDSYNRTETWHGKIKHITDKHLVLDGDLDEYVLKKTAGDHLYTTWVYIIEKGRKTKNIRAGEWNDICIGDEVVIRAYDTSAADVLIYRD